MVRNKPQQSHHTFEECFFWRDETEHQIAVSVEVVKMAGVNQNALLLDQRHRQVFVGPRDRHTEGGVPTAFDMQAFDQMLRCKLAVEFSQIACNPPQKLWHDRAALIEQLRQRKLYRR